MSLPVSSDPPAAVPVSGGLASLVRRASSLFFSATFLKFLVVGTFNTLNGTFLAWLYSLFLQPNVAFVVGYATSVTISFFLNSWIVFNSSRSFRKYVKFVVSYIPNFLVQNVAVIVVYNLLHFDKLIAYIAAAIVGVPVTFLLLKFFTFRDKVTPPVM